MLVRGKKRKQCSCGKYFFDDKGKNHKYCKECKDWQTKKDIIEMARMYNEYKMSFKKIGNEYGITRNEVVRVLRKNNHIA